MYQDLGEVTMSWKPTGLAQNDGPATHALRARSALAHRPIFSRHARQQIAVTPRVVRKTRGCGELQRLSPDDWRLWWIVRLQALEEAPYAFGTSLSGRQGEGDRESLSLAGVVSTR
jgi:hypothetical protein